MKQMIQLKIPKTADFGDTIDVDVIVDSGTVDDLLEGENSNPWVGIYSYFERNPMKYLTYYSLSSLVREKSTFKFDLPSDAWGKFKLKLFSSSSNYESLASSNMIEIGPTFNMLKLKDGVLLENRKKELIVSWEQKSGKVITQGWIGLYYKDENDNSEYIDYKNIVNDEMKNEGSVTFAVDDTPCFYQAKLFVNDIFYTLVVSMPHKLQGTKDKLITTVKKNNVIVEYDIIGANYDGAWSWIGIFKSNEKNGRNYLKYSYLGDTKGTLVFGDMEPGKYKVKYFPLSSVYEYKHRSKTLVVPSEEKVKKIDQPTEKKEEPSKKKEEPSEKQEKKTIN